MIKKLVFLTVLILGIRAADAQQVCQAIEELPCMGMTSIPCSAQNCNYDWLFNDYTCPLAAKETRAVNGAKRNGVRPAWPGEAGFLSATHTGTNYCYEERFCSLSGCTLTVVPTPMGLVVVSAKCQSGLLGWTGGGDNYVLLTGNGNCTGSTPYPYTYPYGT